MEHSNPLTRDFHLVFTTASIRKHRIAVFSEEDGSKILHVLGKHGAQVITRRVLPPPCADSSIRAARALRPISEGAALILQSDEEKADQTDQGNNHVKMRMDTGRKGILRRKSTGSASDVIKSTKMTDAPQVAQQLSLQQHQRRTFLPRSSSMSASNKNVYGHKSWFRLNQSVDDLESARGLSTGLTKKKQSDQSLNSDELSSVGSENNNDHDPNNEVFEDPEVRCSSVTSSSTYNASTSEDEDMDIADGSNLSKEKDGTRTYTLPHHDDHAIAEFKPPPKIDNEKLEKFKFMLVNLEEDDDMLDPAEFGIDGDYIGMEFSDYPEDENAPEQMAQEHSQQTTSTLSSAPGWIRKSFEELDLDVVRTEHEHRRKNSQKYSNSQLTHRRSGAFQSPNLESDSIQESSAHTPDNSDDGNQFGVDVGCEETGSLPSAETKPRSQQSLLVVVPDSKTSKRNQKKGDTRPTIMFADTDEGTEV